MAEKTQLKTEKDIEAPHQMGGDHPRFFNLVLPVFKFVDEVAIGAFVFTPLSAVVAIYWGPAIWFAIASGVLAVLLRAGIAALIIDTFNDNDKLIYSDLIIQKNSFVFPVDRFSRRLVHRRHATRPGEYIFFVRAWYPVVQVIAYLLGLMAADLARLSLRRAWAVATCACTYIALLLTISKFYWGPRSLALAYALVTLLGLATTAVMLVSDSSGRQRTNKPGGR